VVAALREERRPLGLVVGVPDRVVALLRHEALVVVLVDGGAPCRTIWHWRVWDPTDAQPPRAGQPEVWRRHVPCLVQGARHPLVELLAAKAVHLMPGGLHLCGMGAVLSWESSAARTRRAQAWMRQSQ
jgi:hypothetical protein